MPEVINPFSKQAKRIVKNAPAIHELPESIFALAKEKVVWKKDEKRPPRSILRIDGERDVLSYHLLFLSAGLNFSEYSNEVKLVKDVVYRITKDRLIEAKIEEDERFRWRFDDKFDALESDDDLKNPGYKVPWKSLLPLIRARERKLTDWNIKEGYVHSARRPDEIFRKITSDDLIEYYSHLVACEAVEYMSSLMAKSEDSALLSIRDSLKGIADSLKEVSEESYRASFISGKSKKFTPENFPPCIQSVLQGVSSGSRNYAISVLLTSFLSYARAAPERSTTRDSRISSKIRKCSRMRLCLLYMRPQRGASPRFLKTSRLRR
jgi:DNA primase large subunit